MLEFAIVEPTPDSMLRHSLMEFGVPRRHIRQFSIRYFREFGCMHCDSKKRPHYRFALCRSCYQTFCKRMDDIKT